MNGQLADVTSRKEQRADHIGIGGESEALPGAVKTKDCCVIHCVEQRVGEGWSKDALDQVVRGFAATAVAEGDLLVAQIELVAASLAGALDFLQDIINTLSTVWFRRTHKKPPESSAILSDCWPWEEYSGDCAQPP